MIFVVGVCDILPCTHTNAYIYAIMKTRLPPEKMRQLLTYERQLPLEMVPKLIWQLENVLRDLDFKMVLRLAEARARAHLSMALSQNIKAE